MAKNGCRSYVAAITLFTPRAPIAIRICRHCKNQQRQRHERARSSENNEQRRVQRILQMSFELVSKRDTGALIRVLYAGAAHVDVHVEDSAQVDVAVIDHACRVREEALVEELFRRGHHVVVGRVSKTE